MKAPSKNILKLSLSIQRSFFNIFDFSDKKSKFFGFFKQVFQNHVYFSNRSAAFLKMNKPLEAVEDAVKARV